jgi:transcription elongation factor Elf1
MSLSRHELTEFNHPNKIQYTKIRFTCNTCNKVTFIHKSRIVFKDDLQSIFNFQCDCGQRYQLEREDSHGFRAYKIHLTKAHYANLLWA